MRVVFQRNLLFALPLDSDFCKFVFSDLNNCLNTMSNNVLKNESGEKPISPQSKRPYFSEFI